MDPQEDDHRPGEPVAADLGKAATCRDAQLGAHRLDEHRSEVGRENDPKQHVPVFGAGRHVGREVPWIDVGDRGDEGRTEKRHDRPDATALAVERPLGGSEHAKLAWERVLGPKDLGRRDRCLDRFSHQWAWATKIARARPRGTVSRRPLILTSIGPSNWLPATTAIRVPGVRPRRSSSRSLPASSSETPWT